MMKILRRLLGVFVMIAGLIGLILSLAGLVGLWMVRPMVVTTVNSTIATLQSSVDTSQKAMVITNQALGATVDSVEALSTMLNSTADTVEATKPIMTQMNTMMGKQLPATLEATTDSLRASQEAALSLESTIKSLDTFRTVMSAVPFVSSFIPAGQTNYNPQKSMAASLGEVADSLNEMPGTLTEMAKSLDTADDNLDNIKGSLTTMASSVTKISASLREYQTMIGQSNTSMENLKVMLANAQNNLGRILNWTMIVFAMLLVWMIAAQVVIFSQGWELFQGTASRMEGKVVEIATAQPGD
jgi:methyl-accepting chemotaxis protein